ncbi:MAG: T9SS type A sorting domain-containing protein [Bacteroidales bacterium]|nr:T9SS type A sorting domain-containing protein [Bacteroidales bacterium]
MKKINTIVTYIFLLVAPYFSICQNYWEIVNVPDTIQIKCMAANNQNHIYLGTGGNNMLGGIYRTVDNCNSWEFLVFENHSIGFIELNAANHFFTSFSSCIYKSINNGISWDTLFYYTETVGFSCLKTYNEDLIFAGLSLNITGIIRSNDSGENWEEVFILPSNAEFFYDFAILNEDTIYACTTHWFNGGGVYRSVDSGDNWEHIGMYDFHCMSLAKNSNGDIFVGTYGHNTQYWLSGVYVLYNGDEEWVQLYTTLVNDIAVNSDDHLFVATDYGVLESTDNGQTFEYINDGLFTGDVDDLAIDSSGFLYASSYDPCNMARSFEPTITGNSEINITDTTVSIINYPNPFSDKTIIQWDIPEKDEYVYLIITDASGKTVLNIQIENTGSYVFISRFFKPGILYYSIVSDNKTCSGKMVLIR